MTATATAHPPAPRPDRRGTPTDPLDVLVVGAGFAGIGATARLRADGVTDVVVLERAHDLGGVWRDNTYPGAACDVKSHLYSFSFAPHDWTRTYAPQAEILDYLHQVARVHGVVDHCRFGREVAAATWDDDHGVWHVTTTDDERFVARVFVPAVGQLSRPLWPDLPGLDEFAGPVVHSARWDHDLDLDGARVVVVGTGASAIQLVPGIVDRVGALTVLQRSAPWVLPRGDRPYRRVERRVLGAIPLARRLLRGWIFWTNELRVAAFNRRDALLGRATQVVSRLHRQRQVEDPVVRAACEPDRPIGCKRVLVSNDWYPALDRDHVDLVTTPLDHVRGDGIVLADGTAIDADVLVLGTGFRATEFLVPMQVTGRDGVDLHAAWRGGASAHLGMVVPGFPNMCVLYGPNTNLGHNSIVFMLECQVDHLRRLVTHLRERPGTSLDVRPEVAARWDARVQDELRDSVWAAGCDSWYREASGRITTNWPGPAFRYRQQAQFDPAHHRTIEHARRNAEPPRPVGSHRPPPAHAT